MPRVPSLAIFPCALALLLATTDARLLAQASLDYERPPKAIVDLVDTLPTPLVEVSPPVAPGKRELLIEFISGFPTIADRAQPELRLAGLRINPKTNGRSRGRYLTSVALKTLHNGAETQVSGLPPNAKIRFTSWAPDSSSIVFVNSDDRGANSSLWIVDVASARARQIPGVALNGIFRDPCEWLSDSKRVLCKTVPKDRGVAPERSEIPTGPVIQENLGRVTPGPTYEDLLKSPEDERIFDYYATSQVELVRVDGTATAVGKPGVIVEASPSPDARYALVDERHHPYSYLLPFEFFPERVSVINLKTGAVQELVDKPLEDGIPDIHDAVRTGPRDYQRRSDSPATLSWVEARDRGDPRTEAAGRDSLFVVDPPFTSSDPASMPVSKGSMKLVGLPLRFHSVSWSSNRLAVIEERRWKDRKRTIVGVWLPS